MKRRQTRTVGGVTYTYIYGPSGEILDVLRSDFKPQFGKPQKQPDRGAVVRQGKLIRLIREQGGECFYCGTTLDMRDVKPLTMPTVDEVVPRALDGPVTWENQVAACYSCNSRKGSRPPTSDELQRLDNLKARHRLPVEDIVSDIVTELDEMDE